MKTIIVITFVGLLAVSWIVYQIIRWLRKPEPAWYKASEEILPEQVTLAIAVALVEDSAAHATGNWKHIDLDRNCKICRNHEVIHDGLCRSCLLNRLYRPLRDRIDRFEAECAAIRRDLDNIGQPKENP